MLNEIIFGHTDASIPNRNIFLIFININSDLEVWIGTQHLLISERQKSDFIECIWGIGDNFSKEYFLLSVEGVNENIH